MKNEIEDFVWELSELVNEEMCQCVQKYVVCNGMVQIDDISGINIFV